MSLTDSINKASKKQSGEKKQNGESIDKNVYLGKGRNAQFGYKGIGRLTMEGKEETEGQVYTE